MIWCVYIYSHIVLQQTEGAFRSNGTFVNIDTNPGGGNDGASAMVGYTMLIILLTLLPLLTSWATFIQQDLQH